MNKISKKIYISFYDDEILIEGIKYLQTLGIYINEVYSPFPIHGLDNILKLKKTNISELCFLFGIIGFLISVILTWYTMNYDWPQNIGGKPSFTWYMNFPSFIPVIFEFTIFCAAHFMCIYYMISCKLFPGAKADNPDPESTNNKFIIEIITYKPVEDIIFFLKKNGFNNISII